jgi:selenocysteine lyase/cysteine desulfurase
LGWDVLLDAAAFVPTNTLDLSLYKPDFVSISFYKIFGYPTGLGCLLIKKSTFTKLKKRWFAGGTVSLASALTPYHFLIDNHERFENGTLNYLDIPALKIGIEYIEKIGMQRIKERVDSLMNYLHFHLKELKHSNGQNQLVIYGHPERKNTGGTAIMCFFNPDGTKIKFEKIEELANSKNISIRSGCFCNPGIDEINNGLTKEEMTTYFTSRETGNYKEMEDFLKKMRGATRVSVGIATNKADLDAMISLITNLKDQKL